MCVPVSVCVGVRERETVCECEREEDLFGIFRFADDGWQCRLQCHTADQHNNSPLPARVRVYVCVCESGRERERAETQP